MSRHWIGLASALLLNIGSSSAETPVRMEFADTHPKGGMVAGVVRIEVLEPLPGVEEHVLYWGGNPHEKLGNYRPLATRPVPETPKEPWLLEFKSARVPPAATHFVLLVRDAQDQEYPLASLPLLDFGVPEQKAENIRFRKDELSGDLLKGMVRVKRAWNERDVKRYVVYWGDGPDRVLRKRRNVGAFPKRDWWGSLWSGMRAPFKTQDYLLSIEETVPPEAKYLLVYTRNDEGQMSLGVSTSLGIDKPVKENTVELRFTNAEQEAGRISGKVKLVRTKPETGSAVYSVYWAQDAQTRLEGVPPLTEFEIQGFRDGLKAREMLVSSPDATERQLQVTREGGLLRKLGYTIPDRSRIPKGATHLLVLRQQKLWFQKTVDRRQGRVLASVPIIPTEQLRTIRKLPDPVILGVSPESDPTLAATEDEPAVRRWRDREYRGLGLGMTFSGVTGIVLHYHYNLAASWQLQGMLDYTGKGVAGLFGALKLVDEQLKSGTDSVSKSGGTFDVSRTMVSGSLRWFIPGFLTFGLAENLYFGLVIGGASATLNYDNSVATYPNPTRYQHQASANFGFMGLDMGWQGTENYFLEIALMPVAKFADKDSFEETGIPDERALMSSFAGTKTQREYVKTGWTATKNPTRMMVSVGVAF